MKTYYVAELTGVFDRPITPEIARLAVEQLGGDIDGIGCRHMTASDGTTGWGAFLLRRTTTDKAKAETAARWLARSINPDCVFIFTDWQGPIGESGQGGDA